jgi:hypothetical protein
MRNAAAATSWRRQRGNRDKALLRSWRLHGWARRPDAAIITQSPGGKRQRKVADGKHRLKAGPQRPKRACHVMTVTGLRIGGNL